MPTKTRKSLSAIEELQRLDLDEIERILRSALDEDGQGQIPENSGHGDYRPSDILWKILRADGVSDKLKETAVNVVAEGISGFVAIIPRLERGEDCEVQVERLKRAFRIAQLSGAPDLKSVLGGSADTVLRSQSKHLTQSEIAWELLAAYQACGVEEDDFDVWEKAIEKEDFAALAFMSFVLMGREDSLDRLRDLFLSSVRDSDKIDFEFLAEYLVEKQGKEKLSNQVRKWSKVVKYDSRVQEFLALIPGLVVEREELTTYFELPEAIGHRAAPYLPDELSELSEAARTLGDMAAGLRRKQREADHLVAYSSRLDWLNRIQLTHWMMLRGASNRIDDMGKSARITIGDTNKSDALTRQMVDAALEPNTKS